ncbi:hypothetical protein EI74_0801 [Mycoplasma testudineum]|uniref:Oligoendopeptidase F n=1 Tax=Mycoplasma testudineum TaxID=244584 RepID=A0A4R6I9W5_9MOLU|nr:hypothetical protein [Mycoplasma testudineum]OYD26495.1 hypothetical protein CG473_03575 [Mycoplasma testudineum]TDO18983.1 hypothetical protein EI74_0801 [Mycoplasma testudineum]
MAAKQAAETLFERNFFKLKSITLNSQHVWDLNDFTDKMENWELYKQTAIDEIDKFKTFLLDYKNNISVSNKFFNALDDWKTLLFNTVEEPHDKMVFIRLMFPYVDILNAENVIYS